MKKCLTKEDHIELLANEVVKNLQVLNGGEATYIGLDFKRPFGNSDYVKDLCNIIKLKPAKDGDFTDAQEDYAISLYEKSVIPYIKKRFKKSKGE
jgi:hypothetical protein